jgi:hypothetical protein
MRVATVLYEDKMQAGAGGVFPPHDLVLAMVSDLTGREIWALRRQIDANPRNGVAKLIGDLGRTSLLAGEGLLCALVDRDRVAEHLGLQKRAAEAEIIAAMRARSDAPDKLAIYFLDPNIEGLMRSIADCAPGVSAPSTKDHNSRDLFLKRAAFQLSAAARDCVKGKQASLGDLVARLAGLCRRNGGSGEERQGTC